MKLEVCNGSFSYGGQPIFEHLDFEVKDHSVLTILGPNGAGKTTLLKCMMGFLRWKTGEMRLDGKPMADYGRGEIWQHIGYVPQAKLASFSYSVIDTVVMGLNAGSGSFSVPSVHDYDRAYETLEWLGIREIANRRCDEISGGQLQMALIARALIGEPEVLILDEPESNLDMCNQLRVIEAIQKISNTRSVTCIINTHFPDHALMISDDTLFMGVDGHRLIGRTIEVVTEENIRYFYRVCARVLPVMVEGSQMCTVFPYGLAREV